jgi:filamentous hemagglutinin
MKVVGWVLLLVLVAWLYSEQQGEIRRDDQPRQSQPVPPLERPAARNEQRRDNAREGDATSRLANEREDKRAKAVVVRNVRVTDEDKRVVYQGDIDLTDTLDRIERGERLRFSHDGITFENREKRLPRESSGYYREFVHPTTGESGPGGQRVVIGRNGEVYYTPDHYRTFRRVR